MKVTEMIDHVVSTPVVVAEYATDAAKNTAYTAVNIARIALDIATLGQIPSLHTNNRNSREILSCIALIPMNLVNRAPYTVQDTDRNNRFIVKTMRNFLPNRCDNTFLEKGRHLVRTPAILLATIADLAAGALGFIAATATLYQVESINKFTFVHLEGLEGIEIALQSLRNVITTKRANARKYNGVAGTAQNIVSYVVGLPFTVANSLIRRAANVSRTVMSIIYKPVNFLTKNKLDAVNYFANNVNVWTAVTTGFTRLG